MDELEEIKATFFLECDELFVDLESGLNKLDAGDRDIEVVNAVFRAVHSIKGGGGAFGMEALVRYAHVFETLLDGVRSDKISLSPPMLKDMLVAADLLSDHVTAARTGTDGDSPASTTMIETLNGWIKGEAVAGAPPPSPPPVAAKADDDMGFDFKPMVVSLDGPPAIPEIGGPKTWTIRFRPTDDLYANANEPGLLLRELERLGHVKVQLIDDDLPDLTDLEPESSYLAWTVRLEGEVEEAEILEVFEFVEGSCALEITCESGFAADPSLPDVIQTPVDELDGDFPQFTPVKLDLNAPPAPRANLTDDLMDAPPEFAPVRINLDAFPLEPFPMAAAPTIVAPVVVAAPLAASQPAKAAAADAANQPTIRVEPARIDRLIDLVGELVINQAMLAQRVANYGIPQSSEISVGLDELEQLTREIQDGVMAIRAQPVRSVFQRMTRLVREVSSQTGKHVRLVTEGEGTEVDKTVIERISEPITHMLRNAIDHGLEDTEGRIEAGKPEEGVVTLSALHRGGRIVIEVADDGRGINRTRVRQIAIDRGLIAADAQLSDEETDNLIFLPGFSTAAVVSDISGRGVGMDVVRKSVQALGGRISISSRPGKGSLFTLSLPLTLAVLDGMVVDVAGHTVIVPLTAIIETLKAEPGMVKQLGARDAVLAVRDTFLPLVDIGAALAYRSTEIRPENGVILLVESEDGGRAALVADAIHGQRQVVIKSLETNYQQVAGIAAATILGDGRVALILDVDALIAMQKRDSRAVDPVTIAAE